MYCKTKITGCRGALRGVLVHYDISFIVLKVQL